MQLDGRYRCRWLPKYNNVMVAKLVSVDIVDGFSCVYMEAKIEK